MKQACVFFILQYKITSLNYLNANEDIYAKEDGKIGVDFLINTYLSKLNKWLYECIITW